MDLPERITITMARNPTFGWIIQEMTGVSPDDANAISDLLNEDGEQSFSCKLDLHDPKSVNHEHMLKVQEESWG